MKKIFITIFFISVGLAAISQNLPNTNNTSPVPTFYGIPGGSNSVSLPTPYNSGGNTNPTLFNYCRVFTPLIPITNSASIDESSNPDDIKQSTKYYDGFSRAIQIRKRYETSAIKTLVSANDLRPSHTQLSFLSYPTSNSSFERTPFQDQNSYYNSIFPNEQNVSANKIDYVSNATTHERSTSSYAPGKTTVGQNRGTEQVIKLNQTYEVLNLTINNSTQLPQGLGWYPQKQLHKKTTGSIDGNLTDEFYDKNGKLILKRVLWKYESCTTSSSGNNSPSGLLPMPPANFCPVYLETYYVYDDFDRLRYTLSPKAVNALNNNGWVFTTAILENLCDYKNYDEKNRLIESHKAGENGKESFVYDKHERVVISKTPQENSWKFTLYDRNNRVTIIGTTNAYTTRSAWQNLLDNGGTYSAGTLEYYLLYNEAQGLYPSGITGCDILTYTYYDSYPSNGLFNTTGLAYDQSVFTGSNVISGSYPTVTSNTDRTFGRITGTKTKVLKPYSTYSDFNLNDWISEVYFYDDYGKVVQTRAINHRYGVDISSTQYDFNSKMLRNIYTHSNPACINKSGTSTIKTDYYYLARTKQLNRITQQIDNGTVRDIAHYYYDLMGNLSTKNIGGSIETQVYEYNIRGQLTAINSNYAVNSTVSHPTITFGEVLKYDHGFTNNYYNGKIAGMLWRGPGTSPLKAYGYSYDLVDRLTQADYRAYSSYKTSPTSWALNWNTVYTDYTEGNIEYDYNGNISKLKRNGPTKPPVGGIVPDIIDDLEFTYADNDVSNRVENITDNIPMAGQITDYDFKNNGVSPGTNYVYDDNGSLSSDNYKGITIANNSYLNKPSYIDFSNGDKISYVYDANGNKLVEKYSGTKSEKNDYIDAFVYKDNNLQTINHSEGYALYNNSAFYYFFFVKDHLGNVRNVVDGNMLDYGNQWVTGSRNTAYPISFEPGNAGTEVQYASIIDPVRISKPNSTSSTDVYCAELDANNPDKQVGALMMIKVMAGDSFLLSGDCYHQCPDSGYFDAVNGEEFVSSILSSINGPGGIVGGLENPQGQILNGMFSNSDFYGLYEDILNSQTVSGRPKSYLNYLLFDEDLNLVKDESGVLQIKSTEATWETVTTSASNTAIEIGKSGYLVVYTNNMDRSVKAYWDNVSLTKFRGKIVDENHYYPYGITVNTSTSNPTNNRFLFSTNKLDQTNGINVYDFHARVYNPQIGRFLSIDPLKEYHNGYSYCGENPISFTDKSGLGSSSVWGNYANMGTYPASVYLYNGMGISGGGSMGFIMSKETVADGYRAYEKMISTGMLLAGVTFLGEAAFGARALTAGDAAAVESATAEGGMSLEKSMEYSVKQQASFNATNEWIGYNSRFISAQVEYNRLEYYAINRTGKNLGELAYEAQYGLRASEARLALAEVGIQSSDAGVSGYSSLYYYSSPQRGFSVLAEGFNPRKFGGEFTYLTDVGTLTPRAANIQLALPSRNPATSVLQIDAAGLHDIGIDPIMIRRVTGNLPDLGAGGGMEYIYNQNIPKEFIKKLK